MAVMEADNLGVPFGVALPRSADAEQMTVTFTKVHSCPTGASDTGHLRATSMLRSGAGTKLVHFSPLDLNPTSIRTTTTARYSGPRNGEAVPRALVSTTSVRSSIVIVS